MTSCKGKGTAVVCVSADQAVLNAGSSFRRLLFHSPAIRLFLAVLPILAIFSPQFLPAQAGPLPVMPADPAVPVCPVTSSSASTTLNVPEYRGYRAPVGGDYIVIEYDANTHKEADPNSLQASWSDYSRIFDYRGQNNRARRIDANGSFLPVVDTKEKIAVRVCGLHFTDVLTVTTSPTGVPEGGADIRGATVVTLPVSSLTSTLDTLQSGSPTGGATALPGLGLGAPTALPSLSISPTITPGNIGAEDQTPGKYPMYTPATVTASGKQVALMLYSVYKNAAEISRLIDRTMGRPYDAPPDNPRAGIELSAPYDASSSNPRAEIQFGMHGSKSAPGSVNGVAYTLGRDLVMVTADSRDLTNAAAFDKDTTEVQNVNAQISTLAGALTSQAFASNTLTFLNNFSTLTGVLDLAKLGGRDQNNCQSNQAYLQTPNLTAALSSDDLAKLTIDSFANWTPAQILSLDPNQVPVNDSNKKPLRARVIDLKKALSAAGVSKSTTGAGDKPLCSAFEKQKFDDFWDSYNSQVKTLLCVDKAGCKEACQQKSDRDKLDCINNWISQDEINNFEGKVGDQLITLNSDLNTLRRRIGDIDANTAQLYDSMNLWYQHSSVEQTDLLQPLTANSFLRVSIIVQRGYTPFTLANASGTFTPTASTNVVPTAVAAASTSTPAHAVKTILVEVHRVANFNLMGGVMLIHVPTASYGLQASPTPAVVGSSTTTSGGTTTTTITETGNCAGQMTSLPAPATATAASPGVAYSCVIQTQQTQWQVAGMAGLVWFPWGHDYFPRHNGYANFGRNLLPSMVLATSVTSLGNSMGGVNWEPVSGLDFYAGLASANKNALPSGISVNTAIESGSTLQQATQVHAGFAIGVGFDFSVFTSLFSAKTTAASMP